MSASTCALTQTAILLLVCCEVQCVGVINHHFSTDGMKVTFPKISLTAVCQANKLRCFLYCVQDAACHHVGVSVAGEVVLLDDQITPSLGESLTTGYLYSYRVAGTSQQTLRTTEALGGSSILGKHSRTASTGKANGHPDTRKSKMTKHTRKASTGKANGHPDTKKSKMTKHTRIASTGKANGHPDTRKSKMTKRPRKASTGKTNGHPDTKESKMTKRPRTASTGKANGHPDTRKSKMTKRPRKASTGKTNGHPDTKESKMTKRPRTASTGKANGHPDTRKSKMTKRPRKASTGKANGHPRSRKGKMTKHPRKVSTGKANGHPDTRKSKITKHPRIASTGKTNGHPGNRKSKVALLTNSTITRQRNVNSSDVHNRHDVPITMPAHSRPTGEAYISSTYTVFTQTGTEKNSGTDCFVYLDIYGQAGLREVLYLDNKGQDEMAIGANDTFEFTYVMDLGSITKMVLRVAEFGLGPGWLLIGVEVRRKRTYEWHTITETFYTYINKWFQRLDGLHFFDRKEEKYKMNYRLVSRVTKEK